MAVFYILFAGSALGQTASDLTKFCKLHDIQRDILEVCQKWEVASETFELAEATCNSSKCDDFQKAHLTFLGNQMQTATNAMLKKHAELTGSWRRVEYEQRLRSAREQRMLVVRSMTFGIPLIAFAFIYFWLGRWQGIHQRFVKARKNGIAIQLKRDLRLGGVIVLSVLIALFIWSTMR